MHADCWRSSQVRSRMSRDASCTCDGLPAGSDRVNRLVGSQSRAGPPRHWSPCVRSTMWTWTGEKPVQWRTTHTAHGCRFHPLRRPRHGHRLPRNPWPCQPRTVPCLRMRRPARYRAIAASRPGEHVEARHPICHPPNENRQPSRRRLRLRHTPAPTATSKPIPAGYPAVTEPPASTRHAQLLSSSFP